MNIRKINRRPPDGQKNYYLVDACFLVNKYLPLKNFQKKIEIQRITVCKNWWEEIDSQLKKGLGRVYIPAACIAESFKVLAKYAFHPQSKCFNGYQYNYYRKKLSKDLSLEPRYLRRFDRKIKYHDVPMDRDIIISVDRFYELFSKYCKDVGVIDLSIVATAKFLMDFYDIPKNNLHIITLDKALREGIKKSQDLPNAYDPTLKIHSVNNIFA